MLILDPAWRDILPGVSVLLRPPTVAADLAARRAARETSEAFDESLGEEARTAAALEAFSRALLIAAIADWRGVGDAEGRPVPPDPANLALFVDLAAVRRELTRAYLDPYFEALTEKNASSPAPAGPSAKAGRAIAASASARRPTSARTAPAD